MPRIDRLLWWLLAPALLLGAAPAGACTISVTSVAFGSYNPQSPANDDSAGNIALDCPANVQSPVVAIEAGLSGSIAARAMRNGSFQLNYNLYSDATRLILWGNGVVGSTITLSGGQISQGDRLFSRTIYGRIPPGQNVGAGTYSDTLVVTVIF